MDGSLEREVARLSTKATVRAAVERRRWAFAIPHLLATVAFALAPLVPHADTFFGALTAPKALAIAAPANVSIFVSFALYKRYGSSARSYQISEWIEAFSNFALTLAFIYCSGKPRSAFWILPPISAAFWGPNAPFHPRRYLALITLAHAGLAALYVGSGEASAAAIPAASGALCCVVYASLARRYRANVVLEAETNLMSAELSRTLLAGERERLARAVEEGVGRELASLAEELETGGDARLRGVLDDLDSLTSAASDRRGPATVEDLARQVDQKCAPLCETITYASELDGAIANDVLDASTSLALLRVAQELVRNAVIHGRAQSVRVAIRVDVADIALAVVDDGTGLSVDAFEQATGGLANARSWLRPLQGALELVSPESRPRNAGTELRARVARRRA